MFNYWLDVDKTASWDKLIAALKHISQVALAEKIKAMTSKGDVGTSMVPVLHTYIHACMWLCVYGHVHAKILFYNVYIHMHVMHFSRALNSDL